ERRIPPAQRLDQFNFGRQMLRITGAESAQFIHDFRSETLRLSITRTSMHHAMPDRQEVRHRALLFQPCHKWTNTVLVLHSLDRPTLADSAGHVHKGHGSFRETDSIDLAGQHTSGRRLDVEERTLEAR